jgi:hypothetical protein
MAVMIASREDVYSRTLKHLVHQVEKTAAIEEPFSHMYLEEAIPFDIYERMLRLLPDPERYCHAAERHHGNNKAYFTRAMFALTPDNLASLSVAQRMLWAGVAAALTAPELKEAVFTKLARDLAFRYGIEAPETARLGGYSRPTLYRETDGFEIPPHPDTRRKVVTMHLYLPAGHDQLDLGTALYRRRLLAWPFGPWRNRFVKVKQFDFRPNSGYAFVVNNTLARKSWHGREQLRAGAGVRNTLLNTFYDSPREGFGGYHLPENRPAAA